MNRGCEGNASLTVSSRRGPFTAAEVKCCYRGLIAQNRLYEYKMGNRWFVSLSDREKGRGHQTDDQ